MAFSSCLASLPRFGHVSEDGQRPTGGGGENPSVKARLRKANAPYEFTSLQNEVIRLFHKRKLAHKELKKLHATIRNLLSTQSGFFLYEWFQTQILTKGIIIIRENIRLKKGKQFLEALEQEWLYFFTQILPMLQMIFFMLQLEQKQNVKVRQAAIIAFRNMIVLKPIVIEELEAVEFKISSGLKHMFLILQSAHDSYPPNDQQLQLEKLVARVVIPFLGFCGYYEGGSEPVIKSSELLLAIERRSSGGHKRLCRPLSVQAPQCETLEEIFCGTEGRANSVSEV